MKKRSWLGRLIVNPGTSLVLGVLLITDVFTLPDSVYRGGYSAVGRGTTRLLGRPLVHGDPPMDDLIAVYEKGEFRRLHPEEDSWDETTRLFAQRPQDMVLLHAVYLSGDWGFWAPTRQRRTVRVISQVGSAVPAEKASSLRDQFLTEVWGVQQVSPASRALLRSQSEVTEDTPIWRGYAHNAGSLAALLLFVYSLWWVPGSRTWVRRLRRNRAIYRGVCPGCGYSIRDLPEPKCPECGEALEWPARAAR